MFPLPVSLVELDSPPPTSHAVPLLPVLSFLSTWISLAAGESLVQQFDDAEVIVTRLSALVLFLIALHLLRQAVQSNGDVAELPEDLRGVHERQLTLREATALGVALTMTNVGTGVVGGAAKLDIVFTSLLSALSSLLTIGGGCWLGLTFHSLAGQHSRAPGIISALLLIVFSLSVAVETL